MCVHLKYTEREKESKCTKCYQAMNLGEECALDFLINFYFFKFFFQNEKWSEGGSMKPLYWKQETGVVD